MWGLLLFPLLGLVALLCVAVAVGLAFWRRPATWRGWVAIALIPPLGVATIGLFLLGLANLLRALQPSDADRYEEIFKRSTSMSDAQMLSDDFYSGDRREVWLRTYPKAGQLVSMMALPGLEQSSMTGADVAELGKAHAFHWWFGAEFLPPANACPHPRILRSETAPGWREVLLVECPKDGGGTAEVATVYVLARGAQER